MSNYLDSVKYNNKSPSPTLDERIANSHVDIKEQILEQLKRLKVSPGSKDTRSEINKEFRNALSYNARLNKLGEPADTLENVKKHNKSMVDILGHFTLKKLDSKYDYFDFGKNKYHDMLLNTINKTERYQGN